MAADADELDSRAAADALGAPPVGATAENDGDHAEGLDVVDHGRLPEEPVRHREGRLETGLGPPALHGLEECALLPADVAARADEDVEVEAPVGAEQAVSEQPLPFGLDDRLRERFALVFVLVSDVDDATARAGRDAGDGHAFDDEVRRRVEDGPVLDRRRLALVGVADDVLLVSRSVADGLPLDGRPEPRAAEATQVRPLQGVEHAGDVARLEQAAKGAVAALAPSVGIGAELAQTRRSRRRGKRRPVLHRGHHVAPGSFPEPEVGHVVEGERGCAIAAPEAGGRCHRHLGRTTGPRGSLERAEQRGRAAQTTRQVATHADVEGRRRLDAEVREEGGDAVETVDRHAELGSEGSERSLRDVTAVLPLHRRKGFDDACVRCVVQSDAAIAKIRARSQALWTFSSGVGYAGAPNRIGPRCGEPAGRAER